jgi:hypothetical protein
LVSFLLVWQLLWAPLATAGPYHDLNPSGEGEVVVPSPFNTNFPFPVYIPKELKQEILNSDPQSPEDWDDLRQTYSEHMGIYPYSSMQVDETSKQALIKNITFLKPYSDSILFGEFFKGPKKNILNRLQDNYRKVQDSVPTIIHAVKKEGELPSFGTFNDTLDKFTASASSQELSKSIETYVNAVIDAQKVIQTILTLPTENVDPDVVMDMSNAMGLGPLVRTEGEGFIRSQNNIESTEDITKRTTQRFCSTSYAYRYVRGMVADQKQVVDINVDEFSSVFLLKEAMGNDYRGMSLEKRKDEYASEFKALTQKILTKSDRDNIIGISSTWARVPIFKNFEGEDYTFHELINVWLPLSMCSEDNGDSVSGGICFNKSFEPYFAQRTESLFQSKYNAPLKRDGINKDSNYEERKVEYVKSFLSSMGASASILKNTSSSDLADSSGHLAASIKQNPLQYIRIKDQALLLRGLYEGKNFHVMSQDGTQGFTESFNNSNRFGYFRALEQDPQRADLEQIFPELICESLYQRNYVADVLFTQSDINTPPTLPHFVAETTPNTVIDDKDKTHVPFFAYDKMEYWRYKDLDRKALNMFYAATGKDNEWWDADQNSDFKLPPLSLRPWALYYKLYYSDLKPEANIPALKNFKAKAVSSVPASLNDYILPRFFKRLSNTLSLTRKLWQTGLDIEGERSALRPGFNSYVFSYARDEDRYRYQSYPVRNYMVSDRNVPESPLMAQIDSTRANIANKHRVSELMQLSQYVWRSRVLFTPQELYLIIATYFKEFLLPLALLQKHISGDIFQTPGINKLKQFYMQAGTVQYELLYLLQNKADSLMFDLQPAVLSGSSLTPVLDPEKLKEDIDATEAGYVINFNNLWDHQSDPMTTIPEWSKHDQMMNTVTAMEREMNKRVFWCKTLPLSEFSDLAKQVNLTGGESTVRDLVCAIPGYFHASKNLGLFLSKEHLRFETLTHYFNDLLKRKNENKSLMPFLGHVPEVASLKRPFTRTSTEDANAEQALEDSKDKTDLTLTDGINQYQELVNLVFAYQNKLGWLDRKPKNIDQLYNFDTSELNWMYKAPSTIHGVSLSGNDLNTACHYLGTDFNPVEDELVLNELKMTCLFNNVKTVREVLKEFKSGEKSLFRNAFQSRFIKHINKTASEASGAQPYISSVINSFEALRGVFEENEVNDCSLQTFAFNEPLEVVSTDGSLKGRMLNASAHMINALDTQYIGGYIQSVVASSCSDAKRVREDISLNDLLNIWGQLTQEFNEGNEKLNKYFGDDVLFHSSHQPKKFHELSSDFKTQFQEFLSIGTSSRTREASEQREPNNQNLAAELTGVYREMQFESQLHSLVAIKAALSDDAFSDEMTPKHLKNEIPLGNIQSGMGKESYANHLQTVTDIGIVDYSFLIPGFKFSYNRQSSGGYAWANLLDFVGQGGGAATPGTTFREQADNSWFSTWIDQQMCHGVNNNGGRLTPWISKDQSRSWVEATGTQEDWQWKGYQLSGGIAGLGGISHKQEIIDPGYFCNLKYTYPEQNSFRPLSAREYGLISDANVFLEQARSLRENELGKKKREEARYEIEAEYVQAVLARIFLDKLTAHVLIPYQEAMSDLEGLVIKLKTYIENPRSVESEDSSCIAEGEKGSYKKLGCLTHEALTAFYNGDTLSKKSHFKNFAYLKQLYFSLMEDLFPDGDPKDVTSTVVLEEVFKNKLYVALGSLGHIIKLDPNITPENISEEGTKYSILGHVHKTIADIEAFNSQLGNRILTRYPMLEREIMVRENGKHDNVDWGGDVPKLYQLLFVTELFKKYRPDTSQLALERIIDANAPLANAMSTDYYQTKPDLFDSKLRSFLYNYPFSPSDLLTHPLSEGGSSYGQKTFKTFYLGTRIALPKSGVRQDVPGGWGDDVSAEPLRFITLRDTAQALFPWVGLESENNSDTFEFKDSLEKHLIYLEAGKEAQAGEDSLFLQYVDRGDGEVIDFKPASESRNKFSKWIDRLLVMQYQESLNGLQRTYRAIYQGDFVSQINLTEVNTEEKGVLPWIKKQILKKSPYESSEKTLLNIFSNQTIIEKIRSRHGDRYIELEHEYIPSRVYSYMEQEQAYMNIMADMGNMLMASVLILGIIAIADAIIGTKLAGTVISQIMRFIMVAGISTVTGYTLFSLLTGNNVGFAPVLILALLMTAIKLPMNALARRWISKGVQSMLRTAVFDIFIGVVVMDVIGMILDWEIANYTSSAYSHASALFFGYMRMGRVHQALYGPIKPVYIKDKKIKTYTRRYEPLMQDFQYFAYLKQTKVQNFSFAVLGTVLAGGMNVFIGVKHLKRGFHKKWGVRGQIDSVKAERLVRHSESVMESTADGSRSGLGLRLASTLDEEGVRTVSDVALANEKFMSRLQALKKEFESLLGGSNIKDANLRELKAAFAELDNLLEPLKKEGKVGQVSLENARASGASLEAQLSRIHESIQKYYVEGDRLKDLDGMPGIKKALEDYEDVISEMIAVRELVRTADYEAVRTRHFERSLSDREVRDRRARPDDVDITDSQRRAAAIRAMEGDLSFEHILDNVMPYHLARSHEYIQWVGEISETFRFPFRVVKWSLQELTDAIARASEVPFRNRRNVLVMEELLGLVGNRLNIASQGGTFDAAFFQNLRVNHPKAYVEYLVQHRLAIPRLVAYFESDPRWLKKRLNQVDDPEYRGPTQINIDAIRNLQTDLESIRIQMADGTHMKLDDFLKTRPTAIEVMRLGGIELDFTVREFKADGVNHLVGQKQVGRLGEQMIRLVDDAVAQGRLTPADRSSFIRWFRNRLSSMDIKDNFPIRAEETFQVDRMRELNEFFRLHPEALSEFVNGLSVAAAKNSGKLEDVMMLRIQILDVIERINGHAYTDGPVVTQIFTGDDFLRIQELQKEMDIRGESFSHQFQSFLMDADRQYVFRQRADALGFDVLFSRIRHVGAQGLDGFSAIRGGDVMWSEMGPFVARSRAVTYHSFEDLRYHPFFVDEKVPINTSLRE